MTSLLLQLRNDLMLHIDAKVEPMFEQYSKRFKYIGRQRHAIRATCFGADEDGITDNFGRVKQLENVYTHLMVDDLENRSRSSNLRVVSVPESVEGSDTIGIMAGLIPKVSGPAYFPNPSAIEIAHHTPTPTFRQQAKAHPDQASQFSR